MLAATNDARDGDGTAIFAAWWRRSIDASPALRQA
jgi:hypothetical protein